MSWRMVSRPRVVMAPHAARACCQRSYEELVLQTDDQRRGRDVSFWAGT